MNIDVNKVKMYRDMNNELLGEDTLIAVCSNKAAFSSYDGEDDYWLDKDSFVFENWVSIPLETSFMTTPILLWEK